ncbi:polysaccharide biosynthesis protein [Cytobacillus sp. IB215316]|uniref:putative polysaccharide biosynthesis protein n=1 Tax=Cytobacillus sp. IB215316 TaxID=3097354 RepID=UPI002A0F2A95|nr:polysaccharide biosynthesis protein [Cytobacillus sp. IB215316]MDX8363141.1 polysaccharide biosynthesis protein [Cytobacillus sp. IB215316]
MNIHSDLQKKFFLQGTVILSIAGIVTKLLSAGYRIPFQNIVGDIGFYIYQQIYPFYGVFLTLSTYGYPVIISKLLIISFEQQDYKRVKKVVVVSFLSLLVAGIVFCSVLYFFANKIAIIMGDPELTILIKVIAFSFLLMPFISVLRGYFQGQKNMVPTAVSQMVEQFIRVITILIFSILLVSHGYGMYATGAGALFGSITGGLTAIVILLIYYKQNNLIHTERPLIFNKKENKEIIRVLFTQGGLICISGMILILFQLVDSFTLYSLLISSDMSDVIAKGAKGVYDRGWPLIQLGTVVSTSISLSLIPIISSAYIRHNLQSIKEKVNLSIRISIVAGVGASVGLAFIIEPTNIMLFQNNQGTDVLRIQGFTILFSSLILTTSSIFQGMNNYIIPAISVVVALILKGLLNVLLVPILGTKGAAFATIISLLITVLFQYYLLYRKFRGSICRIKDVVKILEAAIVMGIGLYVYIHFTNLLLVFINNRLFSALQAITAVMIGIILFLFVIIKRQVFTQSELSIIPYGNKLAYFNRANKKLGD